MKGLYLAGGAAHPGPGMPMVLMSGWIAADSLDQDAASLGARPSRPLHGQRPKGYTFDSGSVAGETPAHPGADAPELQHTA